MGDKSKISWTDATWNPVVGCSPVSPGCANCYAAEVAASLERRGVVQYLGTTKTTLAGGAASQRGAIHKWTGRINLVEHALRLPLTWRKPRRIFVNSMSDLFHERISDDELDRIFAIMALCQRHTFQVLTKRAERMAEYFANLQRVADDWAPRTKDGRFTPADVLNCRWVSVNTVRVAGERQCLGEAFPGTPWPLPNVWLGVSVEDAKPERLDRVRQLLSIPAAVKFLSIEPLLGEMTTLPLILRKCDHEGCSRPGEYFGWNIWGKGFDTGTTYCPTCKFAMKAIGKIDWVIVGGESGNRYRDCDVAWINSIARQCQGAGVPVWVKQDCGRKPEQQGRIPDEIWNLKQMPEAQAAGDNGKALA